MTGVGIFSELDETTAGISCAGINKVRDFIASLQHPSLCLRWSKVLGWACSLIRIVLMKHAATQDLMLRPLSLRWVSFCGHRRSGAPALQTSLPACAGRDGQPPLPHPPARFVQSSGADRAQVP